MCMDSAFLSIIMLLLLLLFIAFIFFCRWLSHTSSFHAFHSSLELYLVSRKWKPKCENLSEEMRALLGKRIFAVNFDFFSFFFLFKMFLIAILLPHFFSMIVLFESASHSMYKVQGTCYMLYRFMNFTENKYKIIDRAVVICACMFKISTM